MDKEEGKGEKIEKKKEERGKKEKVNLKSGRRKKS